MQSQAFQSVPKWVGRRVHIIRRIYLREIHSTFIDHEVPDELYNALEPFQSKSPQNWILPNWRLLYHHIRELRHAGNCTVIYAIGSQIMSKWWESSPSKSSKCPPYMFYEEMMETLATDVKDELPIDQAELGFCLIEQMMENNVSVGHEVLENLFKLVINTGDPFLRYKFIQVSLDLANRRLAINHKSLKTMLNHMVRLFISTGELEGALMALVRDSGSETLSVKLSYEVNEMLIFALLSKGDIEFAWALLRSMLNDGRIYSRTWGVFINAAAEALHYPALEWVRNAAIIPGQVVVDDWCYFRMAEVASRNGDYRMTRWCILRLKRREAVLNIKTKLKMIEQFMVPLIESHASGGNVQKALQFIERMKETAAGIQVKHVPQLVKALATDSQSMKTALTILKNNCDDPNTSDAVRTLMFSLVCTGFLQSGNPKWALDLYDNLLINYDVKPNLDTMRLFLHHGVAHNDHELIKRISCDCEVYGIPRQELVKLAHREMKRLDDVIDLWHQSIDEPING